MGTKNRSLNYRSVATPGRNLFGPLEIKINDCAMVSIPGPL